MNVALAATLARGGFAANPLRLALTIACIALGVALAAAVHTVHTSALAEVETAAHALAGSADLEIRGPRSGFDDALFASIALRPEVLAASPVVEVDASLAGREETLRVLGIDPFRAIRLQPAFVAGGGGNVADSAALLDARSAWLTPAAAARLGLRKGSTFRTQVASGTVDWTVAGVLDGLADAGVVAVVDIAAAQQRLARLGRLSRIDVRLRPGVDPRAASQALASILPAGVVVSPPASVAIRAESITRAYRVNLDALSFIALATGAFLVFSTLALQAARRRQEFALLRAIGVTRRGTFFLLAFEGAAIGGLGAAIGIALGLAASRGLLSRVGTDLGAGFFSGSGLFAPDATALTLIGLAGVGTAVGGALWVARGAARIDVAEALRDRTMDLELGSRRDGWIAAGLALAGFPLLLAPPIGGLPLAGYAAIAAWLGAAVIAVGPLCRWILARWPEGESAIPAVARAQVRHLPGHLAASVAGIVMSASLCVAMAIMVVSFRVSLEDWLRGVVGADLYVRSGAGGDTGFFDPKDEARVSAIAEVTGVEPLRYDRLAMSPDGPPLSLVARPINARVLKAFRTEPASVAPPEGAVKVWISEAARDLHGWNAGERVILPIAGRQVPVHVAGIIRDYARTWGAVLIDIADYRRLTGDLRANDFAIHLAPGVDTKRGVAAISRAMPEAHGLEFEDAAGIRTRSLQIFDRSFAVTYALEAISILIGLAGVTSSFAALAWSRRREFGVLRFLGFRRRDVLHMLALEGATTGALGAAIGLAAGCAISLVLIHVINRQSFHWTLEVHWPFGVLASIAAAIVLLCAVGARASGAIAVRDEAVLAVKDDA